MWLGSFLTSKILQKEENILTLNSKIQESTDLLVSLGLGTWLLTCVNPSKSLCSIWVWNFIYIVNESLLCFGESRNNVAYIIGKIRLQTGRQGVVSFSLLLQDLKLTKIDPKFAIATLKAFHHPSRPTDFYVNSREQGLSPNHKGDQRRESMGARLVDLMYNRYDVIASLW